MFGSIIFRKFVPNHIFNTRSIKQSQAHLSSEYSTQVGIQFAFFYNAFLYCRSQRLFISRSTFDIYSGTNSHSGSFFHSTHNRLFPLNIFRAATIRNDKTFKSPFFTKDFLKQLFRTVIRHSVPKPISRHNSECIRLFNNISERC